MRMGRSGKGQTFHGVELFNHGVKLFNHGVETSINVVKSFIFDTDIKNFLTIKNSIKWVVKTYLKVLLVSSPLLILSISYLIG